MTRRLCHTVCKRWYMRGSILKNKIKYTMTNKNFMHGTPIYRRVELAYVPFHVKNIISSTGCTHTQHTFSLFSTRTCYDQHLGYR